MKRNKLKTLIVQSESLKSFIKILGVASISFGDTLIRIDGFSVLEDRNKVIDLIDFPNPVEVIIETHDREAEHVMLLKMTGINIRHPQGNIGFAWSIHFERVA